MLNLKVVALNSESCSFSSKSMAEPGHLFCVFQMDAEPRAPLSLKLPPSIASSLSSEVSTPRLDKGFDSRYRELTIETKTKSITTPLLPASPRHVVEARSQIIDPAFETTAFSQIKFASGHRLFHFGRHLSAEGSQIDLALDGEM
ncbi:MAG: hypothetical protein ACI9BD_001591, partial [Candidatus Marinamargulisbacteria bacterium]